MSEIDAIIREIQENARTYAGDNTLHQLMLRLAWEVKQLRGDRDADARRAAQDG
jgi:hypothetical protein